VTDEAGKEVFRTPVVNEAVAIEAGGPIETLHPETPKIGT
jgi:hypothetical protein